MGKRTKEKWENHFIYVTEFMSIMDKHSDNVSLIEDMATTLRNPIVFDNNLEEVKNRIPYHIDGMTIGSDQKLTDDHLIGMSNMVLYMYKNGLHKKWNTVEDFKNTLKALNALIIVTKQLNDSAIFKYGWKFDTDDISDCLRWNTKLKSVGVETLVCNETGEVVTVDYVWKKWYSDNKKFLI